MLGAAPCSHGRDAWGQPCYTPACSWVPVRVSGKARGENLKRLEEFSGGGGGAVAGAAGADGRWHPWISTGWAVPAAGLRLPLLPEGKSSDLGSCGAAGTAPCPGVLPTDTHTVPVAFQQPGVAAGWALLPKGWARKGSTREGEQPGVPVILHISSDRIGWKHQSIAQDPSQ